MKAIIRFYVLATIVVLLFTASCSSSDENPSNGGSTGGECHRIEYKINFDMTYTEVHRYPVYNTPSTNGKKIIIPGTIKAYEIKCF